MKIFFFGLVLCFFSNIVMANCLDIGFECRVNGDCCSPTVCCNGECAASCGSGNDEVIEPNPCSDSRCGDGSCLPECDETCGSCSEDCGLCEEPNICADNICGNNICLPECGEICETCPVDCGQCEAPPPTNELPEVDFVCLTEEEAAQFNYEFLWDVPIVCGSDPITNKTKFSFVPAQIVGQDPDQTMPEINPSELEYHCPGDCVCMLQPGFIESTATMGWDYVPCNNVTTLCEDCGISKAYCYEPDNCPMSPNPDQTDSDGDGFGDACDVCPIISNKDQKDSDMDGYGDVCDYCPNDKNKLYTGHCGCGVPDTDSDGDNIPDCGDNCDNSVNVNQSNFDSDEEGDACDCDDGVQGAFETGMDCGGSCSSCISCTWCGKNVEPIRIKGQWNKGYIDVVFIPDVSYTNNMNQFRTDVRNAIRSGYFMMDNWSIDPIPSNYEDKFNFYIYTGGTGSQPTACNINLPGNFWSDVPFADSPGVLASTIFTGCAKGLGTPNRWAARATDVQIVLHESGHAIFGLVDEYCGNTFYKQNNPNSNVWSSLQNCQNEVAKEKWTLGVCRKIQWDNPTTMGIDCSKDFWRYDPDIPDEDYMTCGCAGTPKFYEADVRRLNYVFNTWSSSKTKGILVSFNIKDGNIKILSSEVVDAHPDMGHQSGSFTGTALSASGELSEQWEIWDPRIGLSDEIVYLDDVDFTIIIPFYDNVKTLELKDDKQNKVTVDLTNTLTNYCTSTSYESEECRTLDLDNNGVIDYSETKPSTPSNNIYLLISVIIVIIAVFIYFKLKPGNKKSDKRNKNN